MLRGAMCLVVLAASAPTGAEAAQPVVAEASVDEGMLLEVRVGQLLLSEAILAVPRGHGLALPLGELADALGIAISVDAERGRAQGFVLREDRPFTLDVATGVATLSGQRLPMDPALVERRGHDLYVDMALLNRWFPMVLSYEPFALVLRVNPYEALPVQARLERERLGAAARAPGDEARFPLVTTPYATLGEPFLDPSFSVTSTLAEGGWMQESAAYSLFGNMDMVGVNAAGYVAGSTDRPLADWRLTLGRKDPAATLLGDLRAREASLGYMFDPGMPLIAGAWSGLGAFVSNYPLVTSTQFDRQSFRGPLPPLWDAQLLQNGFPIAYQPVAIAGEYRFDDVPLVIGPNEFKVVLNGPQGQRREQVQLINIGAGLTPPGEHRYRVSQGVDAAGRPRLSALVERGLGGQVSLAAGAASVPIGPDERHYASVGARGTAGAMFWHGDAAADSQGGVAGQAGAQWLLGPVGLALSQAFTRHFASESFLLSPDPVVARTQLRLDGRLPPEVGWPGTTMVIGRLDRTEAGVWAPTMSAQVGTSLAGLTALHRLDWTPASEGPFSLGSLELGGKWRQLSLRGQLAYSPTALQTVALACSGAAPAGGRWTVDTGYQLSTGQPRLGLGLTRLFDNVTAGVAATVVYPSAVTCGMNFSWGAGMSAGRPVLSPQSLATTGAVRVKAFVDVNRDGRYTPGEPPLNEVPLEIGGGKLSLTDATGEVLVTGLGAFQPIDVDFSKLPFDDPLLRPALRGARVVPRPGRVTELDLAVVAVGEIYGSVSRAAGRQARSFAGVRLELVDADDRVVATALSALDGYYALMNVPPGHYRVRVSPAQLRKLKLAPVVSRAVTIPGDGAVIDGLDFSLH